MSINTIQSKQPLQQNETSISETPSNGATSERANTSVPSVSSRQSQSIPEGAMGKVMENQTAVTYNKSRLVIKISSSSGSIPQNGSQAVGTYQTAVNQNGSAQCAAPTGNTAEADSTTMLNNIMEVIGNLIDLIKDLLKMQQKPAAGSAPTGDGKPANGTSGTGQSGPIDGTPDMNSRLNEMLTQLIELLQSILPLIKDELEKSKN